MKAVNLLPEKHRPRQPTGGHGKGAHLALGVLGAVLIGVLVYVFTLNSINSSKTKIVEANAEAARLSEQANSLGPYGDFAKIKAARVASVKQLASQRFDYERLVRELAHVLPTDVWLVNASVDDGSAGATAAPTTAAAATPAPTGPKLTLQGCAPDQHTVAVTLVRLRELQGATDVSLEHSTGAEDSPTGGASQAAPAAPSGAGDTSCGETHGKPNYTFQANVTFAQTDSGDDEVPNRLGGGS